MNRRTVVELGDVLVELIDHRGKTPKKLGGDWSESGHRVVSALNIKGSRVDDNDHHYVSDELYGKWMKTPLRAGDVLLTSEAPTGEVAYLEADTDWCLGQRLFGLRSDPNQLIGRYLYYQLRGGAARHELLARATGTTVSGIRQSELVKVKLELPSLAEQRGVGGTLGALDAKIDSNRRSAGLLQALSRSIYLDWRQELEGLEESTFGDFADVFGGATPKTTVPENWDGGLAWATPTDITSLATPYLFGTSRTVSESGLAGSSASLHPAGTIFMTSRATIGAFAVTQLPASCNQGFIVVRPRREIDRWFLFEEMRGRVSEMLDRANGSTFLELSRGNFKLMTLSVPGESALHELDQRLSPIHAKAAQLESECARLAALRDTLTPRLLSGEIAVADALEATA